MKPNFKRFNDLRPKDINFDFHIHTNYTDGQSSPEEIVDKAINLKLKAIAFTEHVNKTSEWFDEFSEKIKSLKSNNLKIFLGIEAKALDFKGSLDATEEMIKKSDIVMGVVHRYPNGKGGLIPLEEIKNLGQKKSAEIEFNLAMSLLENNKDINTLGHPFGVYSKFFTQLPEEYMRKLMEKAVEKNIAIEINTKYLLENKKFFRLLREINPYVSIGSDAHNTEEIASDFDIIRKEVGK